MRLVTAEVLGPLDLRPRHFVALTLLRDSGEVTQQGLAEVLALDSTNVVGVLNELEDQGLVERRRVPSDRRRHVVALTETGRERLAAVEVALTAAETEVLAALSPAQRAQLAELLHLAVEGLSGERCAALPPCPGAEDSDC